ncbi:SCP-like protein [Oesophagostomum dentatum]|uniref:SCP-like protein n=1 Tax=Oesophagostomum dentatum TaxID=61180 RepID=A0A0B1RRK8_OESDE|nr:SCP-like protein [Oesophagostomum dentatum]
MRHAQKCMFGHSSKGERSGLGENLYMTSNRNIDDVVAANEASQLWWNELKEKGVGQENRLTVGVFNRGVGHYTQMAWEKSYKLGCAVKHCSGMTMVVCQYGPAGNMLNQEIYTKGAPCSGCSGSCNRAEGLCNV